jgi:hypothetical protein
MFMTEQFFISIALHPFTCVPWRAFICRIVGSLERSCPKHWSMTIQNINLLEERDKYTLGGTK